MGFENLSVSAIDALTLERHSFGAYHLCAIRFRVCLVLTALRSSTDWPPVRSDLGEVVISSPFDVICNSTGCLIHYQV